MQRTHLLYLWFVISLAVVAPIAAADCSAPPSVSVTATPNSTGIVTLNVSYSFPDTTSSEQRTLGLIIRREEDGGTGSLGGMHPSSVSGTWTLQHEMFCERSGNYTYEATATSCQNPQKKSSASYAHDVQPTVSVSYAGPDDQGHGNLVVHYNFPNTSDASQRLLLHW